MATSASKKTTKSASKPASDTPSHSAASKDIWLAGLGAMAQAQAQARDHFNQINQMAQGLGAGLGAGLVTPVGAKVDRLEHLFEDRVARALKSLGLPTAQEVAELQDRVAALEEALEAALQKHRQPRRYAKPQSKPKNRLHKTRLKKPAWPKSPPPHRRANCHGLFGPVQPLWRAQCVHHPHFVGAEHQPRQFVLSLPSQRPIGQPPV